MPNHHPGGLAMVTIGFVVPHWPPAYGGGEQFMDRMVGILLEGTDWDLRILTTTAPREDGFLGVSGIDESAITRVDPVESAYATGWIDHFDSWSSSVDADVYVFSSPASYYRRDGPLDRLHGVFDGLRDRGIPFGLVHYDLNHNTNVEIQTAFREGSSWSEAAASFRAAARDTDDYDSFAITYQLPSAHRPDFLISCSEWSLRLLDPTDSVDGLAFHPIMDYASYRDPVAPLDGGYYQVGFVNPLVHKGCTMALNMALSLDNRQVWLRGGYADHTKASFMEMVDGMISDGSLVAELDICGFVPDIRSFLSSLSEDGLLIFPSHFEGYGMIAVEAMAAGIPVVSTDYPATVEGVGSAAKLVSPSADPFEWEWAIEEVLDDRQRWISAGFERVRELEARQDLEIGRLIALFKRHLPEDRT